MDTFEQLMFQYLDRFKLLFFPEQWDNRILDCSKNEMFVLLLVYRREVVTMTELAEYIHVPLNTATGIISRMEKKAFLLRERSTSDKRVVTVRMAEEGIITGYSCSVNPHKLGYNIKAYINLEMTPKQKGEFYPFIEACPNVLECDCVTGKYSMLIKVAFHTTMELDAFIGALQRFGNTDTQIVFSTPVEHRGILKYE